MYMCMYCCLNSAGGFKGTACQIPVPGGKPAQYFSGVQNCATLLQIVKSIRVLLVRKVNVHKILQQYDGLLLQLPNIFKDVLAVDGHNVPAQIEPSMRAGLLSFMLSVQSMQLVLTRSILCRVGVSWVLLPEVLPFPRKKTKTVVKAILIGILKRSAHQLAIGIAPRQPHVTKVNGDMCNLTIPAIA